MSPQKMATAQNHGGIVATRRDGLSRAHQNRSAMTTALLIQSVTKI
jgi:hypothetical protein